MLMVGAILPDGRDSARQCRNHFGDGMVDADAVGDVRNGVCGNDAGRTGCKQRLMRVTCKYGMHPYTDWRIQVLCIDVLHGCDHRTPG